MTTFTLDLLVGVSHPNGPSDGVELLEWSIWRLPERSNEHVLIGRLPGRHTLRMTSKIVGIEGCVVRTESGSRYLLSGPPATPEQHELQALQRLAALGDQPHVDVTAELAS